MKTIKEYLKEYNKCESDTERWQFVVKYKENIIVYLDNDSTWFYITDENKDIIEDDENIFDFDRYVGWDDGILELFSAIGINATPC